jgi:cytochrome P450
MLLLQIRLEEIPPTQFGEKLCPNLWAIQRDPIVWERPEEFLPK